MTTSPSKTQLQSPIPAGTAPTAPPPASACSRAAPSSGRCRASSPSPRRPSAARSTSACCRSRARWPARSPRRTTCSTSTRSRSSPRPRSASATASSRSATSRSRRSAWSARTRSRSTSAARCVAAMPWATAIAAATTADAARQVAESGDPAQAAIASERAAQLHGLTVVAGDVGDHPEAYTRFVSRLDVHAHRPRGRGLAHGVLVRHRPLAGRAPPRDRAVRPACASTCIQLVSRPIPKTPWRYRFDAVLAGHPLDPIVSEALREVRERTRRLQVFGSYPARRDVEDE